MTDWAHLQKVCPAGHSTRWPNAQRPYQMCPGCPANSDPQGHRELWCDLCKRFYLPPNCLRYRSD